MSGSHVEIKIEKLNSTTLIVAVKNYACATGIVIAFDDNGQKGAKHNSSLEGICPHDRFDTTYGRVKDTDSENCRASNIHIESSH